MCTFLKLSSQTWCRPICKPLFDGYSIIGHNWDILPQRCNKNPFKSYASWKLRTCGVPLVQLSISCYCSYSYFCCSSCSSKGIATSHRKLLLRLRLRIANSEIPLLESFFCVVFVIFLLSFFSINHLFFYFYIVIFLTNYKENSKKSFCFITKNSNNLVWNMHT